MSNAYLTQFKVFTGSKNSAHVITSYNSCDHVPFSHLNQSHFFPESGHHCTFQFLCQMKKNADKVLWTERKFQRANGIDRGSPLYVNQESWNYFLFRLCRHEGFATHNFSTNLTTRSYQTFYHDLTSQSVPLKTNIFRSL